MMVLDLLAKNGDKLSHLGWCFEMEAVSDNNVG